MMIHKFAVDCGGQKVAWWRIASASRALGVDLPQHLPAGFAPIGRLGGRFVFPGFAPKAPYVDHVSMQDLSPDSVVDAAEESPRPTLAQWVTVVDPDSKAVNSEGAFQVASVVAILISSLAGACLLAARRRFSIEVPAFAAIPRRASEFAEWAFARCKSVFAGFGGAFRHSYDSWRASTEPGGGNSTVEHALAVVHSRFAEAEMHVLTLPADLLLRDVLRSELDGLRDRAADVERRASRLGAERASAILRNVLRDLDRIQRIVQGASPGGVGNEADETAAPTSISEAYRVLGLNPEAPDSAVKKIVDALRLSWHPDHARSEADRLNRERRIKQINAAWDLLRNERAAAA